LILHRRADVLRYLKHLGQPYRTDPTNLEPKYARNRVRLEVLPVLEELYPGAGGNVAHGASLLREDLEVLEGLVDEMVHRRGAEVIVPLGELKRMPPALRRHAVRRAYATLVSGEASLDSAAVEAILKLARNSEGTRTMYLSENVVAAVRYGEEIVFYADSTRRTPRGRRWRIWMRGEVLTGCGWRGRAIPCVRWGLGERRKSSGR
jgi:tRNA(Ile)-lysidine synthase